MTIRSILESSRRQLGAHVHYDASGNVRGATPKPAASVEHGMISTIELAAPAVVGDRYFMDVLPRNETGAGATIRLPDYLAAASRVVSAGSRLIFQPEANKVAANDTGVVGFIREDATFATIDRAAFSRVADGDGVAVSALPFHADTVDLETMPSYAFQTTVTRADARFFTDGVLSSAAMLSIAMGIADVIDAVALETIAATNPTAFSLGAAAAAGFDFSDLSALVGTNGTGAAVDAQGVLRAQGVAAALTKNTAGTIVGNFARAAVVLSERITFTASRANASGEVELTAWVNAQALLPQPTAFWSVV